MRGNFCAPEAPSSAGLLAVATFVSFITDCKSWDFKRVTTKATKKGKGKCVILWKIERMKRKIKAGMHQFATSGSLKLSTEMACWETYFKDNVSFEKKKTRKCISVSLCLFAEHLTKTKSDKGKRIQYTVGMEIIGFAD